MRMYDILRKKRDGIELTEEEIRFFIKGYVNGDIPDYQAAAFCMAVFLKGMTEAETFALTIAIRDSGERIDFSEVNGIRADKHSTGGVGDKTSLIVVPVVAAAGVKVAKMSGRGLGHTGGTIDKLESIPGFRTDLSAEEFTRCVNKVGFAIIGQNKNIAPADKKLYALRDVTATVESIPLIASSIMGKKLAADDDCIVLDVKVGSGAFAKDKRTAIKLAETMVDIGKKAGKKTVAVASDMSVPLGNAIGNATEINEAVEFLKGNVKPDLYVVCRELASRILNLAGKGTVNECYKIFDEMLYSGRALKKLTETVAAQGGDPSFVDGLKTAPLREEIRAKRSGYIESVDAESYGTASLLLGAGRNKLEDKIDYGAGIVLDKKTGDYVDEGDRIATLFTSDKEKLSSARDVFERATHISDKQPTERELIIEIIE